MKIVPVYILGLIYFDVYDGDVSLARFDTHHEAEDMIVDFQLSELID